MMYTDFGFPFLLHRIMFIVVPLLMFVIIGMTLIRTFKEWKHNENSPRLTVEAKVVSKRSENYRRMSGKDNFHSHSYTAYYVTFEVESGDRIELELRGHEYGLLLEGDKGKLTFQGTRYLGFERTN